MHVDKFDDEMQMTVALVVAHLFKVNPFWGAILANDKLRLGYVKPEMESDITTAATNGYDAIAINRAFAASLAVMAKAHGLPETAPIGYVLLHEAAHIVADHVSAYHMNSMPDQGIAAMAVDYQVHDMLLRDGFVPPVVFDMFSVNDVKKRRQPQGGKQAGIGDPALHSVVPKADDVVEIYKFLKEQGQEQEQDQSQAPGSMLGDVRAGEARVGEVDAARSALVAEAVLTAKTFGSLSAAGERAAGALGKSRTPWQKQVMRLAANAASRSVKRTRTYRRIGRRTAASAADYIVKPGRVKQKQPGLLVAVDSSGSIDDRMLGVFAAECERILATGVVSSINVIYCDTEVTDRKEVFRAGQKVVLRPSSSGGTAFEPVWAHQRAHYPDVAAVIYLSDLYGSFGDKSSWPKVPVIWGATTDVVPPVGTVVRVNSH